MTETKCKLCGKREGTLYLEGEEGEIWICEYCYEQGREFDEGVEE